MYFGFIFLNYCFYSLIQTEKVEVGESAIGC